MAMKHVIRSALPLALLLSAPSMSEPSGVTKALTEHPVSKMTYAIDHFEVQLRGYEESLIREIEKKTGKDGLYENDIDARIFKFSAFF